MRVRSYFELQRILLFLLEARNQHTTKPGNFSLSCQLRARSLRSLGTCPVRAAGPRAHSNACLRWSSGVVYANDDSGPRPAQAMGPTSVLVLLLTISHVQVRDLDVSVN